MNIEFIQNWTDYLVNAVHTAPLWTALIILFLSSLIEYIIPIFPGDTVMLAGGFFSARGALPAAPVFIVLLLGGVTGLSIGWYLGKLCVRYPKVRNFIEEGFGEGSIDKLHRLYASYGLWVFIFNRFLPGIRGIFIFVAGIANEPYKRVLLWGAVSTTLWNFAVMGAGYFFGNNFDAMLHFFAQYTAVMVGVVLVGLVIGGVYYFRQK